ncbi:hypothetical protein [Phaeobacter sp. 11ANDIMAR09]|uniref:hypothetical protein n=1 Tax=Phaeobacter sp. 11ANDIMAR09 TaxID=1225647 RepID=UPI0006C8A855|nr:hypothetical protein [Phaeobacter sp. 11ANDIMAR09]KPD11362.1 hypothetical protein AN476_16015 [Phaeobacter sp. 11ANDIMAR09]
MTVFDQKEIAKTLTRPMVWGMNIVNVTFWVVNFLVLDFWTADSFQRLGSLWVAILVLLFGFSRLTVSGIVSLINEPSGLEELTFSGSKVSFLRRLAPSKGAMRWVSDNSERQSLTLIMTHVENRLIYRVYSTEVILLTVATLQWGYGDIFHCWINGSGWSKC